MIDKDKLIGSCVQLSSHFDVDRLSAEIDSIPAELWGEYRAEEQREVVAVFLKGYPPIQFKPDEDRAILRELPYIRHMLYEALPGTPRKCLVARMPPLSKVHLHVDRGAGMEDYFTSTLRLHVPVHTNSDVYFYIEPSFFTLGAGELWVINNRRQHGVINDHARRERVHLIVDIDPDEEIRDLIHAGRRPTGFDDPSRLQRLRDAASSPAVALEIPKEKRRRSFDTFADHYDDVRPDYPGSLITDIAEQCGLTACSRILEIGAGTGQATRLFADRGYRVVGLEPSAAMAAIANANLEAFPRVSIVQQGLEESEFPSGHFDLVFAAQSFHWVDTPSGYRKVRLLLKDSGMLVPFWNLHQPLGGPLQEELEDVYRHHFIGKPWFCMNTACLEKADRERRAHLESSGLFRVEQVKGYRWTRRFSANDYLRLLESYADHRLLPGLRKQRLYAGIAEAIDRHGGEMELPYVTVSYLCTARL